MNGGFIEMAVTRIDSRLAWSPNLRELWDFRVLTLLLAYRHIRVRYKQAILGILWALLSPIAFTAIFLIFYQLIPVKASGDLPYVPVVYSGMIVWHLVNRALSDGGTSLTANASIITKLYFPRMIFPISAILAAIFDFLISFILLLGLLLWFGMPISSRILVAPVFIFWIAVLVFGATMWLSTIDCVFRDLRHALPLMLQLGMFVSPVAYITSAIVPERWMWLYEYNPLVAPLEGLRWAVIYGAPAVSPSAEMKSLVCTVLLLATGLVFFARMERTVVDRI